MRNCAASAPQATRNAESSMAGKVHSAASAVPPACVAWASSFRNRTGAQTYHGTRQDEIGEPAQLPRVAYGADGGAHPFQTLVHEMLEQLGEDPTREGLRQTPARVAASLKWLT